MTDRNEALRLADQCGSLASIYDAWSPDAYRQAAARLRQQAERIAELTKEVDAKQAKIDALMLEYCPEEMTQEQLQEWARHQRVVKGEEI